MNEWEHLLLNLPFSWSVLPDQSLRSGAIACGRRDKACWAQCYTCVVYKLAFKWIHSCLQTFLELPKTDTDWWYKIRLLKTHAVCRLFGEVGCCIWRNDQRSWKYNSILCSVAFWHSHGGCCQRSHSWGRVIVWVWEEEIIPCTHKNNTIAGRWQVTCPFRLVK